MLLKGIDNIKQFDSCLKNKRLGLITSISGVDNNLNSTIEVLHEHYHLTALFAPEHGVRGDKDAGQTVDTYIDEATGITVYSLYREDSKHFTKEMLEKVDAVVYDIQDLGVRYYTFISTMIYAMEDCAAFGKEFILLDRPNPLGGIVVEGNVLNSEYKSFVGAYPVATRYGLTPGELALMVKDKEHIPCDLTIIPCDGWKRNQLFPETGQIFIMPSLGIPRFETVLLYPGTCLIEGTNLSEGRGTSCPFEIIGAPFIESARLVSYLKEKKLPGAAFTPAYFTPTSSKHRNEFCQGVHIHITDYKTYESYRTGLVILEAIRDLYPKEFSFLPPVKSNGRPFISLLSGNNAFEQSDWTSKAILEANEAELEVFKKEKKEYHLYE